MKGPHNRGGNKIKYTHTFIFMRRTRKTRTHGILVLRQAPYLRTTGMHVHVQVLVCTWLIAYI